MRRSFGDSLAIIGPILTMASLGWEYVRMKPDYRFLVEPWSMRGYEITQGWVFFTIGAALLIMVVAVAWKGSANPTAGLAIAVYAIVAATIIAAVFADERDVGGLWMRVIAGILIALIAATVASRYTGRFSGWVRVAAFLAGGVIAFLALGESFDVLPAFGVALGMTLLMAWAVLAEPRSLTANRVLMLSALIALFAVAISSGSIRSRLMTEQVAEINIAADYKDVQITSGWLLANLGVLLTLVGGIGMWAKRRDQANAQARAAKQRKAAEESAAEIAASA